MMEEAEKQAANCFLHEAGLPAKALDKSVGNDEFETIGLKHFSIILLSIVCCCAIFMTSEFGLYFLINKTNFK